MKFLKFWFPPLAYSAMIFYVSSLPSVKIPLDFGYADKLVHVLEYLPLGFLWARAFGLGGGILLRRKIFGLAVVLTFLYGLSDEYHQSLVPGRDAAVFDALADTLGGILGAWGYFYVRDRKTARKEEIHVQH